MKERKIRRVEFPPFIKLKKLNKMKKGLLGLATMMFGLAGASQNSERFIDFVEQPKAKPTAKKEASLKGWRRSPDSEYFGRRSEIVTAYTKRGTKQMKLKNALKGNHEFDFITK